MAQRTLLLDLDGTLWDSRPWYAEILAQLSGGSIANLEDRLASGVNLPRLASACGVTNSRLVREAGKNVASLRLYDGALLTLDNLQKRATSMGVVTNLPGWLVKPMVEWTGIAAYFESIVTPRRGVQSKPKPHGIRRALKEMGREIDFHTWMVGDGTVDAEAAEAAGVQFAWASYGYETVEPAGTETVLHSFEDVLGL